MKRVATRAILRSVLGVLGCCGGNVMQDTCGGNPVAGTSSSAGANGDLACPVTTGGSALHCPELEARYAKCAAQHLSSDTHNVNMLLVLDRSITMSELLPSSGLPKWATVRSALGAVFTAVEGSSVDGQADISLGLELFPSDLAGSTGESDSCQMPRTSDLAINVLIHAGAAQLSEVFDVINAQISGGNTPTAEALQQAHDYFTTGAGRCLPGSKWVLLVTNGRANCNAGLTCGVDQCTVATTEVCNGSVNCCDNAGYLCNDEGRVIYSIEALAQVNVKTFVVGMPSSDSDRASLNRFAYAGKMENLNGEDAFYRVSNPYGNYELEDVFSSSTRGESLHSCDIELASTPVNPTSTRVFFDCAPVNAALSDVDSGWMIDLNYNPAHLTFVGDACVRMVGQQAPTHTLDIFTDCLGE